MSDIAIIGMACRFPGADSPAAHWEQIADGRSSITTIPSERWSDKRYVDERPGMPGKTYTRWAGLIDGVDLFDANCFGISSAEAERMDPQQRLLLEVTREAFESAGLPRSRIAGAAVGVFVGISTFDYTRILSRDPAEIDLHWGTGTAISIAANRLSYVFDLRGPSMAIDTACSSSLVALHLACRSLAAQECEMAVAGGVNLLLAPDLMIAFSAARMMAPDGKCKTFDARADGYVRGEGCGMVVLKRLADAVAGGDSVLAVVRGTAINQDGRSNGLTAPNGVAQESVLRAALADAGVEPAALGYVETHGTGTVLGDTIEALALGSALGSARPRGAALAIGSVKTNIGHLEAAAGVAGLIKTVEALRHRQVPPSLNFHTPNPRIPFDDIGLAVATRLTDWPTDGPALAGISSFGFGGTNAHVILEEAPMRPPGHFTTPATLTLPLSAPHAQSLVPLALAHAETLERVDRAVGDHCFSAATRRTSYDHRMVVTGPDAATLARRLRALVEKGDGTGTHIGSRPTSGADAPILLFPAAYRDLPGLAASLLRDEPIARRALIDCDGVVTELGGASIVDALAKGSADASSIVLTVATEIALAELWKSFGVHPCEVVGHGVGEIAAAVTAGMLEREDAMRLAICWEDAARNRDRESAPAALRASLGWLQPRPGSLPLRSMASGETRDDAPLDAAYWSTRFESRTQPVSEIEADTATSLRLDAGAFSGATFTAAFREALGALYVRGHDIHWGADYPEGGTFVPLPITPFIRQRYWRGLPPGSEDAAWQRGAGLDPVRLPVAHPVWEASVGPSLPDFIVRHRLGGEVVLPLGVGLAVAARAAAQTLGHGEADLNGVAFHQTAAIAEGYPCRLQVSVDTQDGATPFLRVHVADGEEGGDYAAWRLWMTAGIGARAADGPTLEAVRARLDATPAPTETLTRLTTPQDVTDAEALPAVITEATAVLLSLVPPQENGLLPVGLDRVSGAAAHCPPGSSVWVHASLRDGTTGNLTLWDESGRVLCQLSDIHFRAAATAPRSGRGHAADIAYHVAWRELPSLVEPDATPEPHGLWTEAAAFTQRIEAIGADFAAAALRHIGWRPAAGDSVDAAALEALCANGAQHRRLIGRLLDILAEEHYLAPADGGWRVLGALPAGNPAADCHTLRADHPSFHREIDLFALCGTALADVLQGQQDPMALLFPGGSTDKLEALYGAGPTMVAANRAAAAALQAIVRSARPVRVLEIGGGTGGTTTHLLKALSGKAAEYVFTDISPTFLTAAQEKFGASLGKAGGFTVRKLDIEADPLDQGFEPGQFDVIVMANVAHATRVLRDTLDRVRSLLVPGGTLILVEQTAKSRFLDLIFGLTSGWWHFADLDVRPDYPLLTPAGWRAALADAGFAVSMALPVAGSDRQSIVLARTATVGRFLVLADRGQVADALAAALAKIGERAVGIAHEGEFAATAEHGLSQPGETWRGVVMLEGFASHSVATTEDLRAAIETSSARMVATLKALGRLHDAPPLFVVTHRAIAVSDAETPQVAQAPLWGLGRTAAIEMPGILGALIDVDDDPRSLKGLALELSRPGAERELALRDGKRFAPRLVRHALPAATSTALSPSAAYLITGGLGSLGLATAEWLAARGARTIVLCGRTAPDPATRKRLAKMAQGGVTIEAVSADVTDSHAMASLIARFGADLPALRGIVHAAGTTADGIVASLDTTAIMAGMQAKIVGADLLDRLTAGLDLDFLVFFSSASAVFGEAGAGIYTAANAFLDAFAVALTRRGRAASSIAWAPWAGTDLAQSVSRHQRRAWDELGVKPLDRSDALAVLGSVLAAPSSSIVAIAIDWATAARHHSDNTLLGELMVPAPPLAEVRAAPRRTDRVLELTSGFPAERRRRIEHYLQDVVRRVFHIAPGQDIDPDQGFTDLGMDSLTALSLLNVLQRDLGLRLPATAAFDHPRISALAELVDGLLPRDDSTAPEARVPDRSARLVPEQVPGDIAALDELAAWDSLLADAR